METMTAVRMHSFGPASVLEQEEVPVPAPGAGEVLVRIHAAGVNPLDWKIRAGYMQEIMPVALPYVPGLELAGVVAAVGAGVTTFAPGDAVYGHAGGGAYAEYAAVPAQSLALKPAGLGFADAAAVPVGATTAWQALREHGGLRAGQRVLILGGAGGVGSFAVQLARQLGAEVIATASAANADLLRELGAQTVLDYAEAGHLAAIRDVDLVFDTVGGAAGAEALAALKPGGALVAIATPPDAEAAAAAGARAAFVQMVPSGAVLADLAPQLESGRLRPLVSAVFPLAEAAAAHAQSETRHGRGRIVLRLTNA